VDSIVLLLRTGRVSVELKPELVKSNMKLIIAVSLWRVTGRPASLPTVFEQTLKSLWLWKRRQELVDSSVFHLILSFICFIATGAEDGDSKYIMYSSRIRMGYMTL